MSGGYPPPPQQLSSNVNANIPPMQQQQQQQQHYMQYQRNAVTMSSDVRNPLGQQSQLQQQSAPQMHMMISQQPPPMNQHGQQQPSMGVIPQSSSPYNTIGGAVSIGHNSPMSVGAMSQNPQQSVYMSPQPSVSFLSF